VTNGKTIKLRIPALRMRSGSMSQAQLAERSGLSKTTISNLESGRLTRIELATIAKLCDALACMPNDLFELPPPSKRELVKRQKKALMGLIGSVTYDKIFDPDELDNDLIAIRKSESNGLRVSEDTSTLKKTTDHDLH
jgi:DNA-binding Xre family transcriptional regulator